MNAIIIIITMSFSPAQYIPRDISQHGHKVLIWWPSCGARQKTSTRRLDLWNQLDWTSDLHSCQSLKKKETGVGPADYYLPPAHRALWSERPSEEDWHFRHFPVSVQTSWQNPRPCPSVLPKICQETSANMATRCWSGDQAVRLGRKPLPDGWFWGINRTEALICMAVDRWRKKKKKEKAKTVMWCYRTIVAFDSENATTQNPLKTKTQQTRHFFQSIPCEVGLAFVITNALYLKTTIHCWNKPSSGISWHLTYWNYFMKHNQSSNYLTLLN